MLGIIAWFVFICMWIYDSFRKSMLTEQSKQRAAATPGSQTYTDGKGQERLLCNDAKVYRYTDWKTGDEMLQLLDEKNKAINLSAYRRYLRNWEMEHEAKRLGMKVMPVFMKRQKGEWRYMQPTVYRPAWNDGEWRIKEVATGRYVRNENGVWYYDDAKDIDEYLKREHFEVPEGEEELYDIKRLTSNADLIQRIKDVNQVI